MILACENNSIEIYKRIKKLFEINEDNIKSLELKIYQDEIFVFVKYWTDNYSVLDTKLYKFKYKDTEKSWKFIENISDIIGFPINATLCVAVEIPSNNFVYVTIKRYIEIVKFREMVNELENLYME
jgi:hypothetical protein